MPGNLLPGSQALVLPFVKGCGADVGPKVLSARESDAPCASPGHIPYMGSPLLGYRALWKEFGPWLRVESY